MSEPKIVAECWTCGRQEKFADAGNAPSVPYQRDSAEAARCRAAGHDVRPVEVKP